MADALDRVQDQPAAVSVLREALLSKRIASAYLFEGPNGVGKQLAAGCFATELIAGNDFAAAQRIAHENHPDVRIFRPRDEGKRNIQVELLRSEILPIAQFAPFEASHAFLIFPEADISFPDFQPEAANALLKTLEEPRSTVHFILLTDRPARLLPTIRSRCQRVPFGRLSDETLRKILQQHDLDPDTMEPALALADGRADRALDLGRDGMASRIMQHVIEIDRAVEEQDAGDLVDLAESLSNDPDLSLILETLSTWYRDLTVHHVSPQRDDYRLAPLRAAIEERGGQVSVDQATARYARIQETLVSFTQNANVRSSLDALLTNLRHVY